MPKRPTDFFSLSASGKWSPIVAKHDQTRTSAGSRPALSAAAFTDETHRAVVIVAEVRVQHDVIEQPSAEFESALTERDQAER